MRRKSLIARIVASMGFSAAPETPTPALISTLAPKSNQSTGFTKAKSSFKQNQRKQRNTSARKKAKRG